MDATVVVRREIGRPRSFQDEDVFVATATVLTSVGSEHLTLGAIAAIVGCSPPALMQRFGSKQSLLRQFLQWSNDQTSRHFQQVRERCESPLDALEASIGTVPGSDGASGPDPAGVAHSVSFCLSGWYDPTLLPFAQQRQELFTSQFAELLIEAQRAGMIRECDAEGVAVALSAALVGAAVECLGLPREQLHERLVTLCAALIDPYRQ